METSKTPSESVKTLVGGIIFLLGGIWLSWCVIENSFHQLDLNRHAKVADGYLVSFRTEEGDPHGAQPGAFDEGIYRFRLPDGKVFQATENAPVGRLNDHVQVEYLPRNPAVNRIKGNGSKNFGLWLLRSVCGALFVLAASLSPGILMIRAGIYGLLKKNEPDISWLPR